MYVCVCHYYSYGMSRCCNKKKKKKGSADGGVKWSGDEVIGVMSSYLPVCVYFVFCLCSIVVQETMNERERRLRA